MDDHSLYGRYPDVSIFWDTEARRTICTPSDAGIETFISNNFRRNRKELPGTTVSSANFYYNEETDGMYFVLWDKWKRLSDARRITEPTVLCRPSQDTGARNCKGCPLRCRCHKSRSERIVQVNHRHQGKSRKGDVKNFAL